MQINSALIESLLYEEESTTLDFKRDQYPFAGKDDRTKCELLKDILAFANSGRREDAYIVIGVEEVLGGCSNVIGVTSHLEDASLQQFINFKTQKPLNFSYTAFEYEGKQIGVIHIPIQERPIYLLKDFGRLKKGVVYIRRGSSTDDADPDEIAKMGQAASLIPDLDIQWGSSDKRTCLAP